MSYSVRVLDHFRHPRHAGELAGATAVVETSNPACGDVIKIWLRIEAGSITDSTFKAAGCVPAIASGSWLVERIRGATLGEAASISAEDIATGLGGLPAASRHAAQLAADALRKALAAFERAPERELHRPEGV
ncbi:MAG TPA: iron-sulfur cluster assembly scaffold protein [Terriglobia bacterium]|nr:iron-sulfur cluster assembly scaffold protein [Terriglobia bacterium]